MNFASVCALSGDQLDGDTVLALLTTRGGFHCVELLRLSDHAVLGHVPHVSGDVAETVQRYLLGAVVLLVDQTEERKLWLAVGQHQLDLGVGRSVVLLHYLRAALVTDLLLISILLGVSHDGLVLVLVSHLVPKQLQLEIVR